MNRLLSFLLFPATAVLFSACESDSSATTETKSADPSGEPKGDSPSELGGATCPYPAGFGFSPPEERSLVPPQSWSLPPQEQFAIAERNHEQFRVITTFAEAIRIAGDLPAQRPPIAVIDSGLELRIAVQEQVSLLGFTSEELSRDGNFTPEVLDALNELNLVGKDRVEGSPEQRMSLACMIDDVSHGTGIALEIGAAKNNFGLVGLLPGTPIVPIRIAYEDPNRPDFDLPLDRLEAALELAKNKGARVVNLSLTNYLDFEGCDAENACSGWTYEKVSALLKRYESDLLVVNASTNVSERLDRGDPECYAFPLCLEEAPNVLGVGSLDELGEEPLQSTSGGTAVDIFAAGNVMQWRSFEFSEGMRQWMPESVAGTSHAAPVVSAAAALVWTVDPSLSPSAVRELLIQTASIHPRLAQLRRLDVVAAVEKAKAGVSATR